MTRLLWLPSQPQSSFKIPLCSTSSSSTSAALYLIPLTSAKHKHILVLYHTQIIQLDAEVLRIVDEIVLEAPIEAFKFDPATMKLTLKIGNTKDTETKSESTETKSESTETETMTESITDTETGDSSYGDIITVTGRICTWSIDCPLRTFVLDFSVSGASGCTAAPDNNSNNTQAHQPVLEVIKDDHVASIAEPSKLQLLLKSNRSLVSSVKVPESIAKLQAKSLIWIDENVFLFGVLENHLQILKYSLIRSASPTNGCNWPLITWSNDLINVHRAGAICSTWYKLKNSEVWDVLNSPVGSVESIQVSLDGSCLLVCGSIGVAFCDFATRSWKPLPFETLLHPKWLGSSHVVALTPDNQQLLLIDRRNAEIMKIPVEDAASIKFIDTYNNWQLLLQSKQEILILGFEPISFAIVKRIVNVSDVSNVPLRQAAFLKEKLFTLNCQGEFLVNDNDETKLEGCESFVVLYSGHFLIQKSHGAPVLWKDGRIEEIEILESQRILAALPFTNCLTLLHSDCPHFSLNDPVQSRFLLPELFAAEPCESFLQAWKDDPLYQMALEYVLLKCINNKELLEQLEKAHQMNPRVLSLALVSLTRKIEVTEASHHLFAHLATFTPLFITKNVPLDDALNFLPFLAKSYDPGHDDAILSVLDALFSGIRRYRERIRKIKEYLAAFKELDGLIETFSKSKIERLWRSGRLIKAFDLITTLGIEPDSALDIPTDKLDYFKVERVIAPEMTISFFAWLETRGHPESVINALKDS